MWDDHEIRNDSGPHDDDSRLAPAATTLFETPRHRAEFTNSPEQTYYQVMFETPDRILVEIVISTLIAACHFPVADGEDISLSKPTIAAEQRVIESGLIAGS